MMASSVRQGLVQQVGEGGLAEERVHLVGDGRPPRVRGATRVVAAATMAQETLTILRAVDRANDVGQRERIWVRRDAESTAGAAARLEDAGARQVAQDLREISSRRICALGDLIDRHCLWVTARYEQRRAECVLHRL